MGAYKTVEAEAVRSGSSLPQWLLERVRRHHPMFDKELRGYLFTDTKVAHG